MHVQLALVAETDCKVFTAKLAWVPKEKLSLLLGKEELAIGCPLGRSILLVPRMGLLLFLNRAINWRLRGVLLALVALFFVHFVPVFSFNCGRLLLRMLTSPEFLETAAHV